MTKMWIKDTLNRMSAGWNDATIAVSPPAAYPVGTLTLGVSTVSLNNDGGNIVQIDNGFLYVAHFHTQATIKFYPTFMEACEALNAKVVATRMGLDDK